MAHDEQEVLTPAQRAVLDALRRLGGERTTREIAREAGKKGNGTAAALGRLSQVESVTGPYQGTGRRWRLKQLTNLDTQSVTRFLSGLLP